MATFSISISFTVDADSYTEAGKIREEIIEFVKSEDLAISGHEIDIEHIEGETTEEE